MIARNKTLNEGGSLGRVIARLGDGLMGRCKWTRKITDVVERLARERLSHEPRGGRIGPEHENPGVMVLHWEPPVVFGQFHFPRILGVEDETPGNVTAPGSDPSGSRLPRARR